MRIRPYNRNLKEPSRELRKNMTEAEQLLWAKVRRKQIHGVQFYRQKPLANFIVDFFCPKAGLVLEVDGIQHLEQDHAERDEYRDKVLGKMDLRVLRFSNHEVLHQIDDVVRRIESAVEEGIYQKAPPEGKTSPLRKGEQGDSDSEPPFRKGGQGGFR